MNNAVGAIKKYFDGDFTLGELEGAIDRAVRTQSDLAAIRSELDEEFENGRLPTQLHQALLARAEAASVSQEQLESTIQRDPDEPTAQMDEIEPTVQTAQRPPELDGTLDPTIQLDVEGPQIVALEKSVSERTLVENEPTIREAVPEPEHTLDVDGSVGESDATMTATVGAPPPLERTEVIAPPLTSNEAPLDFEFPSQSRGTGSNWAHPEQWTDKQQGPIGPGSVIANRYVIESQLGKGGMGIVFKARDRMKEEAQDSNPFIAIKILNGDFREHPQSLIALQREASKAQKLAHPNIVTVYDFSRDGTTVYMTMELMRGDSLADRIRTLRHGGLSSEEARPLILEMATGLAYAHKNEIVHSDFKPGNVFLMRDGRVKLLDFGIARAAAQAGDTEVEKDVFDAGDLGAMTPGYASLEMLNGEPPHPADDVYALGVSAYTLLTGDHPFDRLTAKEALEKGLRPVPIKGLKRREWKAIEQGLAFKRSDRTQNAEEFLQRYRGASPVRKSMYAALAVSIALAMFFGYRSTLDRPGPFPEERRAEFEERMEIAESSLQTAIASGEGDLISMMVEDFQTAYDIHPRNLRAIAGMEQAADEALARSNDESIRDIVGNLVCFGDLQNYKPVARACNDLGEVECAKVIATRCGSGSD